MITRNSIAAAAVGLGALCALLSGACRPPAREQTEPSLLLQSGWNDFRMGEYALAEKAFATALQRVPARSRESFESLYGLGCVLGLRAPTPDTARARDYLRQIGQAPENDFSPWAMLLLARLDHLVAVGEKPDRGVLLRSYQAVIDKYPDHLAGKEAFIYRQAVLLSSLTEADTRQSVAALETFVGNASPEFVGSAYSLLAVAYTTLNEPEKRLAAEIKSLETTEVDPSNPFTEFAWAYWNIATIAEFEVGDFNTARQYYRRLIAEYPTDNRTYGAKQALQRMDDVEARIKAEAGAS